MNLYSIRDLKQQHDDDESRHFNSYVHPHEIRTVWVLKQNEVDAAIFSSIINVGRVHVKLFVNLVLFMYNCIKKERFARRNCFHILKLVF